jgi:hypothetical protein
LNDPFVAPAPSGIWEEVTHTPWFRACPDRIKELTFNKILAIFQHIAQRPDAQIHFYEIAHLEQIGKALNM